MTTREIPTFGKRRPMFGTLAARLHAYRVAGRFDKADALLDAHNRIARVFGDGQPYDEAADWTDLPQEGVEICRS